MAETCNGSRISRELEINIVALVLLVDLVSKSLDSKVILLCDLCTCLS